MLLLFKTELTPFVCLIPVISGVSYMLFKLQGHILAVSLQTSISGFTSTNNLFTWQVTDMWGSTELFTWKPNKVPKLWPLPIPGTAPSVPAAVSLSVRGTSAAAAVSDSRTPSWTRSRSTCSTLQPGMVNGNKNI